MDQPFAWFPHSHWYILVLCWMELIYFPTVLNSTFLINVKSSFCINKYKNVCWWESLSWLVIKLYNLSSNYIHCIFSNSKSLNKYLNSLFSLVIFSRWNKDYCLITYILGLRWGTFLNIDQWRRMEIELCSFK